MNKYIIGVALVAGLSLSSCSDFLDVQPEGSTTTTTYFTSDQQAMDAIDPVYYDLTNGDDMFGRDFMYEQAAACDIVWGRSRSFNTLATFQYTGDEDPLRNIFSLMYKEMTNCNFIIKNLGRKANLTAIETRTLGEAYFLRAFCHFYIAYRYGTDKLGVPFVVFLGEDEIQEEVVSCKDMVSGEQTKLDFSSTVTRVKERLAANRRQRVIR